MSMNMRAHLDFKADGKQIQDNIVVASQKQIIDRIMPYYNDSEIELVWAIGNPSFHTIFVDWKAVGSCKFSHI